MSTANDPSSSYDGPSAALRLKFSGKKREKNENYNTLQRTVIETYKIYEK